MTIDPIRYARDRMEADLLRVHFRKEMSNALFAVFVIAALLSLALVAGLSMIREASFTKLFANGACYFCLSFSLMRAYRYKRKSDEWTALLAEFEKDHAPNLD